jgi:hypothetical protein
MSKTRKRASKETAPETPDLPAEQAAEATEQHEAAPEAPESEPPLPPGYTILALETSCDETAAAVVRDGRTILANVVASSLRTIAAMVALCPKLHRVSTFSA